MQYYLDRFRSYIHGLLKKTDVYLVIDILSDTTQIARRESTRHERDKGAIRVYTIRNTTRLPPHKVMLTVTRNKVHLKKKGLIVADDTDVFVLLRHLCCQCDIPA